MLVKGTKQHRKEWETLFQGDTAYHLPKLLEITSDVQVVLLLPFNALYIPPDTLHGTYNVTGGFTIVTGFARRLLSGLHDLYPDDQVNQVFARGVLIWLLRVAHIVLLRRDDGYIAGGPVNN